MDQVRAFVARTPKVNPDLKQQASAVKGRIHHKLDEAEATVKLKADAFTARASIDQTNPADGNLSLFSVAHVATGLHDAEASRASTIGLIYALICVAALVWLPFLGTENASRNLVLGLALGTLALASFVVWHLARTPTRYTRRVFRVYGAVCVATSMTALVYLGPFSPTALAITLGISFFGQGTDKVGAWVICMSAIVLCALLFVAIITGLMPDVGVFQGYAAGPSGMSFMALMVPMVLTVTLFQARWSRRAIEDAMASAVSAVMDINQKNVQLEEAQAELERVFGEGGLAGRQTGSEVGQYRLGPLLGRGASGEVYDAFDQDNGIRAAVKLLNCAESDRPEVVARFHREGEISRKVRSPHVATVYRYGQDQDGMLYIAMERLDGADLAAILRRKGKLSVRSCQNLVKHVCAGLSAAHDMGVVHRDVKPHNVFLHKASGSERVWKVLDFGVSKWLSSNATVTQGGGIVGTPRYMSPEQARGDGLDHRSDVYSLGAVLYRCLTGSPPYKQGGLEAIAAAAYQRPIRPRHVLPDLDPQIEAVLSLAMAPNPLDRFNTSAALASAFLKASNGRLSSEAMSAASRIRWHQ